MSLAPEVALIQAVIPPEASSRRTGGSWGGVSKNKPSLWANYKKNESHLLPGGQAMESKDREEKRRPLSWQGMPEVGREGAKSSSDQTITAWRQHSGCNGTSSCPAPRCSPPWGTNTPAPLCCAQPPAGIPSCPLLPTAAGHRAPWDRTGFV